MAYQEWGLGPPHFDGKNYQMWQKRSGGHKKKERVMVAGASDIDSSPCYSSSSSSDEDENRHKGKQSSKNINASASPPKAFAAWYIAPYVRRATRMTQTSTPRKR
jgi:hypothetical protein